MRYASRLGVNVRKVWSASPWTRRDRSGSYATGRYS